VTAPSRATPDGRAYLDLRTKASNDRRPFDELLQLYALEAFLGRLAGSRFAGEFVLKGGVLLAAFGERRPTRDVDLQAEALDNDAESVRTVVCEIATLDAGDGVVFDTAAATAEVIRDEDEYTGVRVNMEAHLATAHLHSHVDVNVGDPIIPDPEDVHVPLLLGGELVVRGYPLVMVHAEKIVTAIARGTVNTRWRDFGDMYLLARHHPVDGAQLSGSIVRVAEHRNVQLASLDEVLSGYGSIGQPGWAIWRGKRALEDRLPEQFDDVLSAVIGFADPAIGSTTLGQVWDPTLGRWS